MSYEPSRPNTAQQNLSAFLGQLKIDRADDCLAILDARNTSHVVLLGKKQPGRLIITPQSQEVKKSYPKAKDLSGIDAAICKDAGTFLAILPAD